MPLKAIMEPILSISLMNISSNRMEMAYLRGIRQNNLFTSSGCRCRFRFFHSHQIGDIGQDGLQVRHHGRISFFRRIQKLFHVQFFNLFTTCTSPQILQRNDTVRFSSKGLFVVVYSRISRYYIFHIMKTVSTGPFL